MPAPPLFSLSPMHQVCLDPALPFQSVHAPPPQICTPGLLLSQRLSSPDGSSSAPASMTAPRLPPCQRAALLLLWVWRHHASSSAFFLNHPCKSSLLTAVAGATPSPSPSITTPTSPQPPAWCSSSAAKATGLLLGTSNSIDGHLFPPSSPPPRDRSGHLGLLPRLPPLHSRAPEPPPLTAPSSTTILATISYSQYPFSPPSKMFSCDACIRSN